MSIQDDLFDLDDHFKKRKNKDLKESWGRVMDWAIDQENEVERLTPIVGHMKESIRLMFPPEK